MKVLHAGNMTNLGYIISKSLRKLGVSAELLMPKTSLDSANPLSIDPALDGELPDWITTYDLSKRSWKLDVIRKMRQKRYDLIHSYVELPMFSYMSRRPYVSHTQGSDLREMAFSNTIRGVLLRRAYRKSKLVIISQPDHIPLVPRLKIRDWIFLPLPWDLGFAPKPVTPPRVNVTL